MKFDLVITGVGGQGVLTLSKIIAQAALHEGYDVKTSELHGLAQRGGHIECHVRFGPKVYSSLVRMGNADLIIGLEPVETLRACHYGSKKKTKFLVNTYKMPPLSVYIAKEKYPSLDEIEENLRGFSSKVILIPASEFVKKETGKIISTNVYLAGKSVSLELLPLKKDSVLMGIRAVIPKKHLDINEKIFELAFK